MAIRYFAELDEDNKVINVIEFENDVIENNRNTLDADDWVTLTTIKLTASQSHTGKKGVKFIETYTDGTRKQKAQITMDYNETKNKFLSVKPYDSWSLNSDDDWEAPTAKPTSNPDNEAFDTDDRKKLLGWNETDQRWEHQVSLSEDPNYYWNGNSWVSI